MLTDNMCKQNQIKSYAFVRPFSTLVSRYFHWNSDYILDLMKAEKGLTAFICQKIVIKSCSSDHGKGSGFPHDYNGNS